MPLKFEFRRRRNLSAKYRRKNGENPGIFCVHPKGSPYCRCAYDKRSNGQCPDVAIPPSSSANPVAPKKSKKQRRKTSKWNRPKQPEPTVERVWNVQPISPADARVLQSWVNSQNLQSHASPTPAKSSDKRPRKLRLKQKRAKKPQPEMIVPRQVFEDNTKSSRAMSEATNKSDRKLDVENVSLKMGDMVEQKLDSLKQTSSLSPQKAGDIEVVTATVETPKQAEMLEVTEIGPLLKHVLPQKVLELAPKDMIVPQEPKQKDANVEITPKLIKKVKKVRFESLAMTKAKKMIADMNGNLDIGKVCLKKDSMLSEMNAQLGLDNSAIEEGKKVADKVDRKLDMGNVSLNEEQEEKVSPPVSPPSEIQSKLVENLKTNPEIDDISQKEVIPTVSFPAEGAQMLNPTPGCSPEVKEFQAKVDSPKSQNQTEAAENPATRPELGDLPVNTVFTDNSFSEFSLQDSLPEIEFVENLNDTPVIDAPAGFSDQVKVTGSFAQVGNLCPENVIDSDSFSELSLREPDVEVKLVENAEKIVEVQNLSMEEVNAHNSFSEASTQEPSVKAKIMEVSESAHQIGRLPLKKKVKRAPKQKATVTPESPKEATRISHRESSAKAKLMEVSESAHQIGRLAPQKKPRRAPKDVWPEESSENSTTGTFSEKQETGKRFLKKTEKMLQLRGTEDSLLTTSPQAKLIEDSEISNQSERKKKCPPKHKKTERKSLKEEVAEHLAKVMESENISKTQANLPQGMEASAQQHPPQKKRAAKVRGVLPQDPSEKKGKKAARSKDFLSRDSPTTVEQSEELEKLRPPTQVTPKLIKVKAFKPPQDVSNRTSNKSPSVNSHQQGVMSGDLLVEDLSDEEMSLIPEEKSFLNSESKSQTKLKMAENLKAKAKDLSLEKENHPLPDPALETSRKPSSGRASMGHLLLSETQRVLGKPPIKPRKSEPDIALRKQLAERLAAQKRENMHTNVTSATMPSQKAQRRAILRELIAEKLAAEKVKNIPTDSTSTNASPQQCEPGRSLSALVAEKLAAQKMENVQADVTLATVSPPKATHPETMQELPDEECSPKMIKDTPDTSNFVIEISREDDRSDTDTSVWSGEESEEIELFISEVIQGNSGTGCSDESKVVSQVLKSENNSVREQTKRSSSKSHSDKSLCDTSDRSKLEDKNRKKLGAQDIADDDLCRTSRLQQCKDTTRTKLTKNKLKEDNLDKGQCATSDLLKTEDTPRKEVLKKASNKDLCMTSDSLKSGSKSRKKLTKKRPKKDTSGKDLFNAPDVLKSQDKTVTEEDLKKDCPVKVSCDVSDFSKTEGKPWSKLAKQESKKNTLDKDLCTKSDVPKTENASRKILRKTRSKKNTSDKELCETSGLLGPTNKAIPKQKLLKIQDTSTIDLGDTSDFSKTEEKTRKKLRKHKSKKDTAYNDSLKISDSSKTEGKLMKQELKKVAVCTSSIRDCSDEDLHQATDFLKLGDKAKETTAKKDIGDATGCSNRTQLGHGEEKSLANSKITEDQDDLKLDNESVEKMPKQTVFKDSWDSDTSADLPELLKPDSETKDKLTLDNEPVKNLPKEVFKDSWDTDTSADLPELLKLENKSITNLPEEKLSKNSWDSDTSADLPELLKLENKLPEEKLSKNSWDSDTSADLPDLLKLENKSITNLPEEKLSKNSWDSDTSADLPDLLKLENKSITSLPEEKDFKDSWDSDTSADLPENRTKEKLTTHKGAKSQDDLKRNGMEARKLPKKKTFKDDWDSDTSLDWSELMKSDNKTNMKLPKKIKDEDDLKIGDKPIKKFTKKKSVKQDNWDSDSSIDWSELMKSDNETNKNLPKKKVSKDADDLKSGDKTVKKLPKKKVFKDNWDSDSSIDWSDLLQSDNEKGKKEQKANVAKVKDDLKSGDKPVRKLKIKKASKDDWDSDTSLDWSELMKSDNETHKELPKKNAGKNQDQDVKSKAKPVKKYGKKKVIKDDWDSDSSVDWSGLLNSGNETKNESPKKKKEIKDQTDDDLSDLSDLLKSDNETKAKSSIIRGGALKSDKDKRKKANVDELFLQDLDDESSNLSHNLHFDDKAARKKHKDQGKKANVDELYLQDLDDESSNLSDILHSDDKSTRKQLKNQSNIDSHGLVIAGTSKEQSEIELPKVEATIVGILQFRKMMNGKEGKELERMQAYYKELMVEYNQRANKKDQRDSDSLSSWSMDKSEQAVSEEESDDTSSLLSCDEPGPSHAVTIRNIIDVKTRMQGKQGSELEKLETEYQKLVAQMKEVIESKNRPKKATSLCSFSSMSSLENDSASSSGDSSSVVQLHENEKDLHNDMNQQDGTTTLAEFLAGKQHGLKGKKDPVKELKKEMKRLKKQQKNQKKMEDAKEKFEKRIKKKADKAQKMVYKENIKKIKKRVRTEIKAENKEEKKKLKQDKKMKKKERKLEKKAKKEQKERERERAINRKKAVKKEKKRIKKEKENEMERYNEEAAQMIKEIHEMTIQAQEKKRKLKVEMAEMKRSQKAVKREKKIKKKLLTEQKKASKKEKKLSRRELDRIKYLQKFGLSTMTAPHSGPVNGMFQPQNFGNQHQPRGFEPDLVRPHATLGTHSPDETLRVFERPYFEDRLRATIETGIRVVIEKQRLRGKKRKSFGKFFSITWGLPDNTGFVATNGKSAAKLVNVPIPPNALSESEKEELREFLNSCDSRKTRTLKGLDFYWDFSVLYNPNLPNLSSNRVPEIDIKQAIAGTGLTLELYSRRIASTMMKTILEASKSKPDY